MTVIPKYAMPTFKNSLEKHVVYHDLLQQIVDLLNKIPNIGMLKNDLELILHIMKIIEVLCSNDPAVTKVDKKNLLINSLKTVMPDINEYETNIASNAIDFIFNAELIVIEKSVKNMFQWATTPFRSIYKKLFRKNE